MDLPDGMEGNGALSTVTMDTSRSGNTNHSQMLVIIQGQILEREHTVSEDHICTIWKEDKQKVPETLPSPYSF